MQSVRPRFTALALFVFSQACLACGSSAPTTKSGAVASGDAGGNMGSVMGSVLGDAVSATPKTALPAVPQLAWVNATVTGDDVELTFEPVDGAADYRVYVLPNDSDVTTSSSGHVTVAGATYRCAGNRMAQPIHSDTKTLPQGDWVVAQVDGVQVGGYARTLADATLGYVYATPGDGRIPIYAVGDPNPKADNSCGPQRFNETRSKRYLASQADYTQALAAGWRDDGIAFYAPAASGPTTTTVYVDESDTSSRYYFPDGPEAAVHSAKTPAFYALTNAAAGTTPLMRVFYQSYCGLSHDEIVAGQARFDRAYHQGDSLPVWKLHWSGLTGPTTLVVEALDSLCPYPNAYIAPVSVPGVSGGHEPWLTVDDARDASATGEVYINAQGAPTNTPKAIARTFVSVAPAAPPALDWFEGFGSDDTFGPFTPETCDDPIDTDCFDAFHQGSPNADVMLSGNDPQFQGFGVMMGELWSGLADMGGGAYFRYMPRTQAKLTDSSFLYVTMQVDSLTSGRRYPQIFISDPAIAPLPVAKNLQLGNSIVIESEKDPGTETWPYQVLVELCDHVLWDVDAQCPAFPDFRSSLDPSNPDPSSPKSLAPAPDVSELAAGIDHSMRYEVYASTKRVYVFVEGQPLGCADFPSGMTPSGTVNVAFGDVLYHSGAEVMNSSFLVAHDQHVTIRHFDNLGFKSGVPAPKWDEKLRPCMPSSTFGAGGP